MRALELLRERLRSSHSALRMLNCHGIRDAMCPLVLICDCSELWEGSDENEALALLGQIEDALGYLALLQRLDQAAWEAELLRIWHSFPLERLQYNLTQKYPFKKTVGLEIQVTTCDEMERVERHQVQRREQGLSAPFQEVLRLVRASCTAPSDCDGRAVDEWQDPKVPVRLFLNLDDAMGQRYGDDEIMHCLLRVCQNSHDDKPAVFKIAEATLFHPGTVLDAVSLPLIQALLDDEIIRFYPHEILSCELPRTPQTTLSVLEILQRLSVTRSDDDEDDSPTLRPTGVKRLEISPSTPSYWLPALLSAAQISESLEEISITCSFEQLRADRQLEWLAYALVSRHVLHDLESVEFDCSRIQSQDIAVIRSIAVAERPLGIVFGCDDVGSSKDDDRYVSHIDASRFHLYDPAATSTDVLPSHTTSDDQQQRQGPETVVFCSPNRICACVIGNFNPRNEWTRVLLPGHGQAWVHCDDVATKYWEITCSREERGTTAFQPIPTIGLRNVAKASVDAALALLGVLSPGLTRLDVEFAYGVDVEHWWRQIPLICNDLKEIRSTETNATALHAIVDAFAARTLALTLMDLTVRISSEQDVASVQRFFHTLGDKHHPLACLLERLLVQLQIYTPAGFEIVDSIKQMLDRNTRLTMIHLGIQVMHRFSLQAPTHGFDTIARKNLHDKVVVPMATPNKIAFLSVLAHPCGPWPAPSTARLDARVVASVFEFAAHTHTRGVVVQVM